MNASPRTRVELLLAATAMVVSLSTLGVYLYQAKVMGEQQRTTVWPYLEWSTSNVEDFHISVRNKGVGPALVKRVVMRLDGKVVKHNHELIELTLGPQGSLKGWVNSALERRVLSPGEEVIPLRLLDRQEARAFEVQLGKRNFEMEITYASVYGDTWRCDGFDVVRLPEPQKGLY